MLYVCSLHTCIYIFTPQYSIKCRIGRKNCTKKILAHSVHGGLCHHGLDGRVTPDRPVADPFQSANPLHFWILEKVFTSFRRVFWRAEKLQLSFGVIQEKHFFDCELVISFKTSGWQSYWQVFLGWRVYTFRNLECENRTHGCKKWPPMPRTLFVASFGFVFCE
jgi:hypothetical protein